MIFNLLFFTSIFFIKSVLFNEFYSNHLMFLYLPIELASMSLSDKTMSGSFIRWLTIGWINDVNEKNISLIIDNNNNIKPNNVIIICWGITYSLYLIYYFIKEKKNIYKWSFFLYNLKFSMINYLSLYLWNLNTIINIKNTIFWVSLINILIFNMITFWYPGIICNFMYGQNLYLYREKYYFLIMNFHLKYKYYNLVLILFKILIGVNVFFINYVNQGSNYDLLALSLLYVFITNKINFFKNIKFKHYINIINIFNIQIIILSIIYKYKKHISILVIQYIYILIMLLLIIIFNIKLTKNTDQSLIIMEEL